MKPLIYIQLYFFLFHAFNMKENFYKVDIHFLFFFPD